MKHRIVLKITITAGVFLVLCIGCNAQQEKLSGLESDKNYYMSVDLKHFDEATNANISERVQLPVENGRLVTLSCFEYTVPRWYGTRRDPLFIIDGKQTTYMPGVPQATSETMCWDDRVKMLPFPEILAKYKR